MTTRGAVARYYDGKTRDILAKYGPGPRVHFHTGLVDDGPLPEDLPALRAAMHHAQERLLERVAGPSAGLAGHVLDVGCGLGGTALWLAERGVSATGVTIVRAHVELARAFAEEAGVADTARFLLADAHDVPGTYDHALAVESSCYLDRPTWFRHLSERIARGGRLHIVDCFTERPAIAQAFDVYWHTRIGSIASYAWSAEAHGWRLLRSESLAEAAAPFWRLSRAWTHRSVLDPARRERSLAEHQRLERHFLDGAIQYQWLTLERT